MNIKKIKYTEGGGNIYQDLGFLDSEERLAKAKLAMKIEEIIAKKDLKQVQAANILGVKQPKVSALINGKLEGFSMEKLIHFLNLLNQDVEIVIKNRLSRRKSHGHLRVAFT